MKPASRSIYIIFILAALFSALSFSSCELNEIGDKPQTENTESTVLITNYDQFLTTMSLSLPGNSDQTTVEKGESITYTGKKGDTIRFTIPALPTYSDYFVYEHKNLLVNGEKYEFKPSEVKGEEDILAVSITLKEDIYEIFTDFSYTFPITISSPDSSGMVSYEKFTDDGSVLIEEKFDKTDSKELKIIGIKGDVTITLDNPSGDAEAEYICHIENSYSNLSYNGPIVYQLDKFSDQIDMFDSFVFTVGRIPYKYLTLTAPEGYGFKFSISDQKYELQPGKTGTFKVPYEAIVQIDIIDPFMTIKNVSWSNRDDISGTRQILDYEKFESGNLTVSATTEIKDDWIIRIEEDSLGSTATLTPETTRRRNGRYTEYVYPALTEVHISVPEYLGTSKFAGWAETNSRGREIDIRVENPMITLVPMYYGTEKIDGVIYVEPKEIWQGSTDNLGSEGNPYTDLEYAINDAMPGDEIRLIMGTHLIYNPIVIDKDIKITGGWQKGRGQQMHQMPETGYGAPTNLNTIISPAAEYTNDTAHPNALFIIGDNAKLTLESLRLFYNSGERDALITSFIYGTRMSKLYMDNAELTYLNPYQNAMLIHSLGEMDISDSSFRMPAGQQAYGINQEGRSVTFKIRRSAILIGSDKSWISSGLKLQTANRESIVDSCYIEVKNGENGLSNPPFFASQAMGIAMSNGLITNTTVSVDSKVESRPNAAMGLATGEQGGQIIVEASKFIGQSLTQAEITSFIDIKGGNSFFLNNSILFKGALKGTDIVTFENSEAALMGNYIQGSEISGYCNPVVARGSRLMFYNNTIYLERIYNRTSNPSTHLTLVPSSKMDSDAFIVNNLVIAGPGLEHVCGLFAYKSLINGLYNNAFIDMPATPADVAADPNAWGNSVFSLTTNGEDRISFKLSDEAEWSELAKDNTGEDCGESKEGWNADITGYDKTTGRAYLIDEPEVIGRGGLVYDMRDLLDKASSLGFSFPQVPFDYSNAIKDMNGRSRFPSFSIGAIESMNTR